ncbi:hypothetical protein FNV43_RR21213 [Rhamnella rubrinervis]|uniref:Uncharacterized protein n=1 Tax=Rhamnella rubrinervis TaxID=2594499 RepID=A0A8K0E1A1_9ROSA|nr:hypothetical protein FNV43_RR21213 [Rhamnella rubrinervis]
MIVEAPALRCSSHRPSPIGITKNAQEKVVDFIGLVSGSVHGLRILANLRGVKFTHNSCPPNSFLLPRREASKVERVRGSEGEVVSLRIGSFTMRWCTLLGKGFKVTLPLDVISHWNLWRFPLVAHPLTMTLSRSVLNSTPLVVRFQSPNPEESVKVEVEVTLPLMATSGTPVLSRDEEKIIEESIEDEVEKKTRLMMLTQVDPEAEEDMNQHTRSTLKGAQKSAQRFMCLVLADNLPLTPSPQSLRSKTSSSSSSSVGKAVPTSKQEQVGLGKGNQVAASLANKKRVRYDTSLAPDIAEGRALEDLLVFMRKIGTYLTPEMHEEI